MPTLTVQLPWTVNNQDAHDSTPVINRVQDNFDALVNAIGTLAAAGLAPTGLAGGDLTGSYPAPQIAAGVILNADINAAAGIVYSKLSLTNSILNADIAAAAGIVYSKLSLTNSIVNADVAAGAAITYAKLVLTNSVTNADIAAAAGIVYSKLNLSASIVGGDIAASLKPSGTAVAATESLRALGSTASTALAGNTTLDAVTAPAANVSLNSHKITSLTAGTASTDARAMVATGSFSAWLTTAAISLASGSVIPFDTEEWDISGWHDITTNKGRFTPLVAGVYRFSGRVRPNAATDLAADQFITVTLAKNGAGFKTGQVGYQRGTALQASGFISACAQANGTTDFFELFVVHNTGGSLPIGNAEAATYWQGELIGV